MNFSVLGQKSFTVVVTKDTPEENLYIGKRPVIPVFSLNLG
jgi:hypothetical protein